MQRALGRGLVVGVGAALGVMSAAQLVGGCGSAFDDGLTQADGAPSGTSGDGGTTIVIVVGADGGVVASGPDASTLMTGSDGSTGNPGTADGGAGDASVSSDAGCGTKCEAVVVAKPTAVITTLAATDDDITWLQPDGLYVSTSTVGPGGVDDSPVHRFPVTAPAGLNGLAVSASIAYVCQSGLNAMGGLQGYPLGTGDTLMAAQNNGFGSIATMNDIVYTGSTSPAQIMQWTASLLDPVPVNAISNALDVHAVGGLLYYSSGTTVYACDPMSCTPAALFDVPQNNRYAPDLNHNVFWASNGHMYGCNAGAPCASHPTSLASVGTVTGIASDGTHLYWADTSTPGIYRATISGGTSTASNPGIGLSTPEKIADGAGSAIGMTFNTKSIFWSQGVTTPVIYSLPR